MISRNLTGRGAFICVCFVLHSQICTSRLVFAPQTVCSFSIRVYDAINEECPDTTKGTRAIMKKFIYCASLDIFILTDKYEQNMNTI